MYQYLYQHTAGCRVRLMGVSFGGWSVLTRDQTRDQTLFWCLIVQSGQVAFRLFGVCAGQHDQTFGQAGQTRCRSENHPPFKGVVSERGSCDVLVEQCSGEVDGCVFEACCVGAFDGEFLGDEPVEFVAGFLDLSFGGVGVVE